MNGHQSHQEADGTSPQTDSHLLEESILPVWRSQRTIGFWGFIWLWIGMAVIIATFQLGAGGVAGLSLAEVVVVIFLANLVLGVVMTLTADIGTEHGLSFSVYLRAPFGIKGTHLPAVSRGVVAAIWFGIQTYLGALALNGIVEYLTGFDSWVTWYLIFAVVQIVNTALGIRAVEMLASIAAPCILAISIWMYYTLDVLAKTQGINIWTFAGGEDVSVIGLFFANMAFWSALAVDIPNLTRFLKVPANPKGFRQRNRNVFVAQFIALPATQAWIALIGGVSFIAAGDWNPVSVIQAQGAGFTLVVLLLMVILAQWSTNNAANLIPAALTFVNAGAPRVSYAVALVLAGIIGTLAMPWLILNNLFTFLSYYGALLSAVGGIMVADYYLLRRRRLNVPDLFNPNGQFRFASGFNPAGLVAWVIGGGLAILFLEYAYAVGFLSALLIYWLLMKTWIMPRYPQQEVNSGFDDQYLATSVGRNWVFDKARGFSRLSDADTAALKQKREDL
ncbi:NCS1 family transporter [Marinobacterium mangrovicola]|uniref:NCS1 family nucleobase:cation symporter-1 n=1 Tax=Marinobacterium mangrovicola TaxID=1476959 RepID=A0A4V2PD26_9GAMM|nr:NCS1 family transporter [Marinobacterium mangrovicola]TCK03566.1 NCS1 family nucleobase:cation symporter-1 [Marinobacterium mangrovicola]